jgi:hypothetical protein
MAKAHSDIAAFAEFNLSPDVMQPGVTRLRPFMSSLVDIDAEANSQPALDIARASARRSEARLRIVNAAMARGAEGTPIRRQKDARFVPGIGPAPGSEVSAPHDTLLCEVFQPRPRDPLPGEGFGVNQIGEAVRCQQASLPALSLSSLAVGVWPALEHPRDLAAVNAVTKDPEP